MRFDVLMVLLRGMCILAGKAFLSKMFFIFLGNRCLLYKKKKIAPEEKIFPSVVDPVTKGPGCRGERSESLESCLH